MNIIASFNVWKQVSADGDSVKKLKTEIFSEKTTLKEVFDWYDTFNNPSMGISDLIITKPTIEE